MTTMPTRIDGGLFAAAKASGALHSRSAAQQIDHWARIGRALESSAGIRHRDIEAVLAGDADYDALREREQAIVRAAWDESLADRIETFDLRAVIVPDGVGWAENAADGTVSVAEPT